MADRKPFLLRIDPAVLDAVQRWANDDLRSLNAQIEFLLRRAAQVPRFLWNLARWGRPQRALLFGPLSLGDDWPCTAVLREARLRGQPFTMMTAQPELFAGNSDPARVLPIDDYFVQGLRRIGSEIIRPYYVRRDPADSRRALLDASVGHLSDQPAIFGAHAPACDRVAVPLRVLQTERNGVPAHLVGDLIAQSPKARVMESRFKGLSDVALSEARRLGCTYADIRFTRNVNDSVAVRDKIVTDSFGFGAGGMETSAGFGVRVIHSGVWGFSSSPIVTPEEIKRIVGVATEGRERHPQMMADEELHGLACLAGDLQAIQHVHRHPLEAAEGLEQGNHHGEEGNDRKDDLVGEGGGPDEELAIDRILDDEDAGPYGVCIPHPGQRVLRRDVGRGGEQGL